MNSGLDPYKPYDFLKEYNENFINFSYKVMINIYVICYIYSDIYNLHILD